jgi:enoyl-CoA hydratase
MIEVSLAQGVLTLALKNPGKKNAINMLMHEELERVWHEADADPDVRVIVLTGSGDAFCSGADLGALKERADAGEPSRPMTRGARRIFWSMLDCEKPIVSKVRGVAYGLGVSVALAADVVVAAEGARFCDSHVKAGIAPGDGGAALWPLLIGFHRAKELLMLGEPVAAKRAAEIGLINHCVPEAQLDDFVNELVGKLRDGAPLAIAWAKMSVNLMLKQMMAGAFETSLAYDMLSLRTLDHQEGATAFLEKRKPNFRGV